MREILAREIQCQFHWIAVYSQAVAELKSRFSSYRKSIRFWERLVSTPSDENAMPVTSALEGSRRRRTL